MELPERMMTIGVIARELNAPTHRIQYIVRSRAIQPAARAGQLRIFDRAQVERIRRELARGQSGGDGGEVRRGA